MSNPRQQHGAFSWCELMTSDAAAAKAFYSKVFGWTMADEEMKEMGMTYTVLKANGQDVGGLMPLSAPQIQGNPPPHWGVYVTVEDVDATVELIKELGGTILVEPNDIPDVGQFAVFQDPQGATLSIISYTM